jgi:hypothetical protein
MSISDTGKGWSGRRYGSEGYGIRIKADAGAGTLSDISVESTEISNAAGSGIRIAGETGVVNLHRLNLHHNDGHGLDASDASATSLGFNLTSSLIHNNQNYGVFINTLLAADSSLFHNTFYANGTINLAVISQSEHLDIRNNVFSLANDM